MKYTSLIYLIVLVFINGCITKDINLNLPDYQSKLVVNGELNTDNEISLQVSRSLPIMQTNDSSGYVLNNAVVKVIENGIDIGNATLFAGRYVLNKKPKASASYRIDVSSGSFTPVYASVNMPKKLPLVVKFIDSIGTDPFGFKISQLSVQFTDDGSESNYYKLLIKYYNSSTKTWFPFDLISNDIIFLNNDKLGDGGYIFSDRTFQGKIKQLSFNVPQGIADGTPKFEISIKSFTEDYYDYLRAVENYSQSGNGISNDPIILKTNITNGIGMIGAVSNAKDTIF